MTKGALKDIFSRNRGAVKTQKTTVGDTVARLWFFVIFIRFARAATAHCYS